MLPLDSPQWSQFNHAYGPATDLPDMLRDLEGFPPTLGYQSPPYFMLWSSLCHQGDVYTASYAAIPHIVRILASAPEKAGADFFQLLACIEIGRVRTGGAKMPAELADDYFKALEQIPALAAAAGGKPWDDGYCRCVLAAIAVSKGHHDLGDALLEMEPEVVNDFNVWYQLR